MLLSTGQPINNAAGARDNMPTDADVVVVGGGSTGCSILYNLAKEGIRNAVLIDKAGQVGAGQTSRSTALVRTHYTVETVAKMALLSYHFFKNFGRNLPGRTGGYVETGLIIGAGEDAGGALKTNVQMLNGLGIESNMIDGDEARRLEPRLDTSAFEEMVYEPHAGYAEPTTTAAAFAGAAAELGAEVRTGTRLLKLERSGQGYTLQTSAGPIQAEKVVLATGVWSKPIFASLGIDIPIKAARHPVAEFKRPEEYRGKRPVVLDIARASYYKPEGGFILFVGSLELELDISSEEVDPDNYNEGISFEEVERFSTVTAGAIPVMGEKGVHMRGYAGVYDNTPDQQPIIDHLSAYGYDNLYCLVGLSGHGFKLSPEYGRIMASMVVDGRFKDYDVSIFKLSRFDEGKLLSSRYKVGTIG